MSAPADTARLPDFVVAGARKSASTWLATCLGEHPQIHLPESNRGVFYFDRHYGRGLDWYRRRFASAPPAARVGEASPSYFADEETPGRMGRDLPDAVVVLVLRNPVARAFSDYQHAWRKGDVPRTATFGSASRTLPSIVAEGEYGRCLERWLGHYPREAVSVHLYEDIAGDAQGLVSAVFTRLGVDTGVLPPSLSERVNPAAAPRNYWLARIAYRTSRGLRSAGLERLARAGKQLAGDYLAGDGRSTRAPVPPAMTAEDRRRLAEHYGPDAEHLSRLVGRDMVAYWGLAGASGGRAAAEPA